MLWLNSSGLCFTMSSTHLIENNYGFPLIPALILVAYRLINFSDVECSVEFIWYIILTRSVLGHISMQIWEIMLKPTQSQPIAPFCTMKFQSPSSKHKYLLKWVYVYRDSVWVLAIFELISISHICRAAPTLISINTQTWAQQHGAACVPVCYLCPTAK